MHMTQVKVINPAIAGRYQFTTATGSQYEIVLDGANKTLVRRPRTPEGKLRRDNQPIKILDLVNVQVSQSAQILLEPLGSSDHTLRITSRVAAIDYRPLSE
ncbi:hypothetical protein [Levilactobacillus paucivorans]|nr:hypothetical protein [Levilactobacillus paucivorans]